MPSATGSAEASYAVVVAVFDIPTRRSIAAEELAVKFFPDGAVPPGAAVSVEQVIGKMSDENFYVGEPIMITIW